MTKRAKPASRLVVGLLVMATTLLAFALVVVWRQGAERERTLHAQIRRIADDHAAELATLRRERDSAAIRASSCGPPDGAGEGPAEALPPAVRATAAENPEARALLAKKPAGPDACARIYDVDRIVLDSLR